MEEPKGFLEIRVHLCPSVVEKISRCVEPMTKIAIVEDKKIIRESLTEFVQTDPECRCVCVCATGGEALKEIPKHQPDIVLMDIQLPDFSGIECTSKLKQLLPSVHIIMVTV